jgi:SAM-dependent methyltransferase
MPSLRQHLTERDLSAFKRAWFAQDHRQRGRVLDLPAGHGEDAAHLHALGYDVVPADLFPEEFTAAPPEVTCVPGDMAAPLPFPDGSFEYVLNSEGIEHLTDQYSFLEECFRVLRPGGQLVLTTPNLLSLRGRLAFLLNGNRALRSFVDEVTSVWGRDERRLYHGHAFLVNYFQLRYMLRHVGFTLEEVVATRFSWTSLLLSPLIPCVRWATRRTMARARRRNPDPAIYDEIARHVFSAAMLYSSNLFLVARRVGDPVPVPERRATGERAAVPAALQPAGKA